MVRTDCLEKLLSRGFEKLGEFIGYHPVWFLITPLILSAGLGSGFYFLQGRLSNDIEEQFTPFNGRAKDERRYIQETFPENDSTFSRLRLSTLGSYATVIVSHEENILTVDALTAVLDLDSKIRLTTVGPDGHQFQYKDICAVINKTCMTNDILDIIEYNASSISELKLMYPWHHSIPLYLGLGNVELKENSNVVERAKAIQLFYYLKDDNETQADLWLEGFIELMDEQQTTNVSYTTSRSLQWEFEKSPDAVISLFSITYAIVITFSIATCWRLDNVRTKVWVATSGVLSTGLAVLSGFGLLLLLDQPFVMTAASCPFMILGIGVDDMFIMIAGWQRTNVKDRVPARLGHTYKDAAVSITITSLTDALALFLGCITPFGSVRSFCLYAGTCVMFCYLYSVTFLGACMALNGQREEQNKHWFTCAVVSAVSPAVSAASSVCDFDMSVGKIPKKKRGFEKRSAKTPKQDETGITSDMFEKYYGPFLTQNLTKVFVFFLYCAYLGGSIYGCWILEQGLDIRNLALDDSYIVKYYDDEERFLSVFSSNVMVAVKEPISYWDEGEMKALKSCISDFEQLTYFQNTSAWFDTFEEVARAQGWPIDNEDNYRKHLEMFLEILPVFRQDININISDGKIIASRFFVQTLNNEKVEVIMTDLRITADKCNKSLLVYHPSFIYYDQYTVIVENTIQTIVIAAIVMLVISLLLIPSLISAVLVAFSICSVVVGLCGFMTLWDVNLDSISMINLVMSIGFSVDFSAHISYAFVCSRETSANRKAIDALSQLGYPVLQGAVSTILGVVVLSTSGSYIFRTFFKIVFLVILFGLLHGLVFIPVFLTMFQLPKKCC